jgi:hypothetical protein
MTAKRQEKGKLESESKEGRKEGRKEATVPLVSMFFLTLHH